MQYEARLRQFLDLDWADRPQVRRLILVTAVVFLVGGIAISLRQHPEVLRGLDWFPVLIVMLVAIPVTIGLNVIEFVLTGRLVGAHIPVTKALEITIIGTAANMLPLPGGTLVRVAGLKAAGTGYRRGTAGTLLVAFVWIGVSFLYAGAWMMTLRPDWLSGGFVGVGIAVLVGSIIWAKLLRSDFRTLVLVSLNKTAFVVIDAIRIHLCLAALGADTVFAQASSLAVAGVLGSAVSIVPAGLGVREGVAASLGPLVGLAAGLGFLATALNRLLGFTLLVPIALVLSSRARTEKGLSITGRQGE